MFFELPITWKERDFGGGNVGLFALGEETMHVIAPPGVSLRPDESDVRTVHWRHAFWSCEENLLPVVSIDPPEAVAELTAAAVIQMLPPQDHEFVRAAMARQLRLAGLYGTPDEEGCRDDKQAQRAGRARSWAIAELCDAFPGEHWFRDEQVSIEVPATVEELLALMPVVKQASPVVSIAEDRCEQVQLLSIHHSRQRIGLRGFCKYVLEDVRYTLLLKLMPSRDGDLKPELRESQQHLRASRGEVLGTGA